MAGELIRLTQEFSDFKGEMRNFKVEANKKLDKIDNTLETLRPLIATHEARINGHNGALERLGKEIENEHKEREKYGWGILGLGLTAFLSLVGWIMNFLSPKN